MTEPEPDSSEPAINRDQILADRLLAIEISEQFRTKKWQSLELWAGEMLDAMLGSKAEAQNHLRDPNSGIRLAAMLLLDERWNAVPTFAETYAEIVITDSESANRGVALNLLAACVRNGSLPELPPRIRHLSPLILGPIPSGENLAEIQSGLRDLLKDVAVFKVVDQKRRSEELHQLAGGDADALLNDKSLTLNALQHPDPNLRCAALKLFETHWKQPPDFEQICIRLLDTDPDASVRCVALSALLGTQNGQPEIKFGKRLRAIVEDIQESFDLRELAYYWLYRFRGIQHNLVWQPLPRNSAQFQAAIDWSFVRSFDL